MARPRGTAADVETLIELVRRLPQLRAAARKQPDSGAWAEGEEAYARVCDLYQRELPWTIATATSLLQAAAHDCGHGGDVQPPVDIARDLLIQQSPNEALLRAVEAYAEGLRAATGVIAQRTKGIAALLMLLDAARPSSVGALFSGPRGARWRKVLGIVSFNGGQVQRAEAAKVATLVAEIGPAQVVADVESLLPCPATLSVAESQIWKYLVVAVAKAAERDAGLAVRVDAIVRTLTGTAWKKPDVALKIMMEGAVYLASRDGALHELTRIEAWFDALPRRKNEPPPPSKVRDMVEAYRAKHPPRTA
ncbi:MAG: hypothetical protein QM820_45855 [Minicystis sp.]